MNTNTTNAETTVRRIFILRPDNLGDVVLFSGALLHIRQHYPQATITLCVKRYALNYLELCPYIDRLICWEDLRYNLTECPTLDRFPKFRGQWRLQMWLRAITRQVIRLRYRTDVLLVPVRSPNPTIHAITRLIPAKTKISIAGDFCNQTQIEDQLAERIYTRRLRLTQERYAEHEIIVTQEFLKFIGIKVDKDTLWPEVWTEKKDRSWGYKAIQSIDSNIIILGIAPGVRSKPRNAIPGLWFRKVINSLSQKEFQVAIFGSKEEFEICNEVSRELNQCSNVKKIINYAGKTTIRQMIEGLRKCDIIVTQDTAALHLAVALHKPTVGIMGGGHYGRFYPWGDPEINRVVNKNMDCYFCNWHCKYDIARCIQEIPYKKASDEIKFLLDNYGSPKC